MLGSSASLLVVATSVGFDVLGSCAVAGTALSGGITGTGPFGNAGGTTLLSLRVIAAPHASADIQESARFMAYWF